MEDTTNTHVSCPDCKGSGGFIWGGDHWRECETCRGTGEQVGPPAWALAHRWIYNIPTPSFDVTRQGLKHWLETEWEFEDVEILDWTAPVAREDSYIIDSVELKYTWGYTDEFAEQHGPKARSLI